MGDNKNPFIFTLTHSITRLMEKKKNNTWFWILTFLIGALIIVFIAQNHQSVKIEFLVINLTAPGFLVFLMVFFLGFLGGWAWENVRRARKRNHQHHQPASRAAYPPKEPSHQGH